MSMLPILFADSFFNSMRRMRMLNQKVLRLNPEEFINNEFRAAWEAAKPEADVTMDTGKFQVNVNVQDFKPEELSIKITGKNLITIEGKHDEKKDDHGFISRHFVRKYVIPEGHDMGKIASKLSTDGILSIVAPRMELPPAEEKEIPITRESVEENKQK